MTMSARIIDVEQLVDGKKFGYFHIKVTALCFLVMVIDGFNISIAGFAGPGLMKQFHVSHETLGVLFSAGLFAGLLGTPIFGVLADRFGRKRVAIWGTAFFGVFTLAALVATSFPEMIVLRFFAGAGAAGVMPTTVALASEFAPKRFRATMVIVMLVGSTTGGVVTGLVASGFVAAYGWQILFWVAGAGPIVIACLMGVLLPESAQYLIQRMHRRAELVRVVRVLDPEIAIGDETSFIATGHHAKHGMKVAALFAGRLAVLTPLIWGANLVSLMVFYFVISWLPTILATSSVGIGGASLATSLFLFGGTLGGLAIMRPLDWFGFLPVPIGFLLGIPALICIGIPGLAAPALLAAIFLSGLFLYGVQFALIAMEGPLFPPPVRGRGLGLCFAAARIGATIGPFLGGVLIGRHLSMQALFVVFAMPLAIGGLISLVITPLYRRQVSEVTHKVEVHPDIVAAVSD
jgi:AAHS family 4-hydroxybenzoate transporter-like MFS transporter